MFGLFNSASKAYQDLKPAEFSAALRQPGIVLLDVRRPDEFAGGHLPGAVNIDVTAPDFAQRVAALDKAKPTYVYCRSGARSATAAGQLSKVGFEHVSNLLGGVLDWPEQLVR
ncbi:rhodanese-like domain-containing protein [Hymenobacter taeanensis]|uniref:Rhodanese-like domain-containing protein n=1 Tax=Hymenobacter taeanensis TaxID=2735321 RepID=A0A6M6BI26_9BACT|nr:MULTISPECIES: rhodanese-like domain-containing protein [Hymenobacter]QJX47797.1 rhodanese-like domain-containing protein [Hymenobacter taeanensis]UOQ82716.1 rhodanese-like domain-containing protein [Hymenobacter sp. 5414T-23]